MQINSLTFKELHPCNIKLSNELIVDPTIDIPFANIPIDKDSEEIEITPPPYIGVIQDKDGTGLLIPQDMIGKINIQALQKVKVAAVFATANVNMIQVSDTESESEQQGDPLFTYLAQRFCGDDTHQHLSRYYQQLRLVEEVH